MKKQKIVLVGGGTGVSELISAFQKNPNVEVSAVVSVFDDGGSTGVLRKQFNIPAVGDFRKCVSASSPEMAKFFEKRKGVHAFGNLILKDLIQEYGFKQATEIFSKFGAVNVLPVSFSNSQIIGELEGGGKVVGEEQLDYPPKKFAKRKVKKISLQPKAKLNPEVKKLLVSADGIVVGPGSLFGSLLVNFEVTGFRTAFSKSKAKKILVMNSTDEFGCRGESAEETAARFKVKFTKVLPRKKWNMTVLVKKTLS